MEGTERATLTQEWDYMAAAEVQILHPGPPLI